MALYLGSERVRIALGSMLCHLNLISVPPTQAGIFLVSADGLVLKDSNGLYLTVKESE